MRLVLVNHYAGSPRHGMEFRPYQIARAWAALGHRVTIVAATHSHLRNENPTIAGGRAIESIDGVEYRWLRTPAYSGNGVGRLLNMLVFLARLRGELRRIEREGPPDAIIASSTYPLDYRACLASAGRCGAAILFEVHDLWPLSPMEIGGYSPRHPYIRVLQRAEDLFCRTADRVVSILPRTLEHLRTRGLDERRFRHIPNGVEGADAAPRESDAPEDLRAWLAGERAAGRFCIGYAGGMVRQNSVTTLLDAARALRDEPFSFLLLGDGWELGALQAGAADLPHVRFAGRRPRAQAIGTLTACDAVWVGLARSGLYRFGIGLNKVFDAMLTGRPVAASITAGNDPIADAGCGISVPAEDAPALVDALRRLRTMDPDARAALGEAGRTFVRREHDYGTLARRFLTVIEEAMADPNPARGGIRR